MQVADLSKCVWLTRGFVLWIVLSRLMHSFGFNIDVAPVANYSVNQGKFGYSLSLYQQSSGAKHVLVGAPLYTSIDTTPDGAIFACEPSSPWNCRILVSAQSQPATTPFQRDGQWFGMSLVSVSNNSVLACAPRFLAQSRSFNNVFWLRGRCSLLNEDLTYGLTLDICRDLLSGQAYGFCMAGFSTDLTLQDELYAMISLPGADNLRGQIAVQSMSNFDSFLLTNSPASYLNSMFGFSVSYGNFSLGPFGDFAGGAPTADRLKGQVFIFNMTDPLQQIGAIDNPEPQVGSYFGGAVCAVDLTGDGAWDLLVGAPYYSTTYNEGRVYVYINKATLPFSGFNQASAYLDGDRGLNGMFGTTIARAGDVNGDGFQDVIIGAPYDGDGAGHVFLYNGGRDGIRNNFRPSQIFKGSQFGARAFGGGLAGAMNMDGNAYDDIAIGSYESNQVHLFRSRPIITLTASMITNASQVPADPAKANCIGPDGIQYSCLSATFTVSYTGGGLLADIDVQIKFELDTSPSGNRRAVLFENGAPTSLVIITVPVFRGRETRIQKIVFVTVSGQYDVLQPILLYSSFNYIESARGCGKTEPCPILNTFAVPAVSISVSYQRSCDDDGDPECVSDLALSAAIRFPNHVETKFIFGLMSEVYINVVIENKAENAFLTMLDVVHPMDLLIVGVDFDGKTNPLWEKDEKRNALRVLVANPLKQGKSVNATVKFALNATRPSSDMMAFNVSVQSASQEKNPQDNFKVLQVAVGIETCVQASIDIRPSIVKYEVIPNPPVILNYTDIGTEVEMIFFIQNNGRLSVDPMQAAISIANVNLKSKSSYWFYTAKITVDGSPCANQLVNPNNYSLAASEAIDLRRTRKRRSASSVLNCESASCTFYTCTISSLNSGKDSTIVVKGRVWEQNFASGMLTSDLYVAVKLITNGTFSNITRQRQGCSSSVETYLPVQLKRPEAASTVEWWIILLAVLGGMFLIGIIIIILFMAGFFKRKIRDQHALAAQESIDREQQVTAAAINAAFEESLADDAVKPYQNGTLAKY